MSTQAWSFNVDHQNDAGFRAWGSDLSAKLAAVGLTQTADTGQVNWVTVTRPSINTNGGYEIWRFNDTAHGTAPIFLRIDYGTGGAATRPRLQLTVGTGSNGSGTITGSVLAATSVSATNGTATGVPVNSYLVYNATYGHIGIIHGASGALAGLSFSGFFIARTVDNTGAPTVTGAMIGYHSGGNSALGDMNFVPVRFASSARVFANTAGSAFCTPTAEIESAVGSDLQNFLGFMPTPRIVPMLQVCAAFAAELPLAATATMQTVGASTYTFLSIDRQLGEVAASANTTVMARFALCILWA